MAIGDVETLSDAVITGPRCARSAHELAGVLGPLPASRTAHADDAQYFDRVLILSDPGAADFTSFVVASHEQLFGTTGVRTALIKDILAVCHTRATDSSVPSGLLGMYS